MGFILQHNARDALLTFMSLAPVYQEVKTQVKIPFAFKTC